MTDQPRTWGAGKYAPPTGNEGRPYGIDVSDHNENIDWAAVAASGCAFAFIKATERANFVANTFAQNWQHARVHGILRSPYHYFHPDQSGRGQAQFFLQAIHNAGGLEAADLHPTLDVEEADGQTAATQEAEVMTFIAEVKRQTGRDCIIYTFPDFAVHNLPRLSHFVAHSPLWMASYGGGGSAPSVPGNLPWTFWQYSDHGSVPGVGPGVDLNVFNGDRAALLQLTVQHTPAPVPTPAPHPVPPPAPPAPPAPSKLPIYFEQTKQSINGAIGEYWQAQGGLSEFGFPISGEIQQTLVGQTYTVQYFERARLEWQKGHEVTRGRIGAELYDLVKGKL